MSKSTTMTSMMDRATGALLGVAMGDALGMPSQTLNPDQIRAAYGTITNFIDAVRDQPVSGGLIAGTITDDTEQSLLLAKLLLDPRGGFDEQRWVRMLLDWENDTRARGVNDLLGPSTKRAIEALLKGVPASQTGRFGTTNGAAMRIVPLGIAVPLQPLSQFISAVEETCRVTHNTSEAIASAAAVAAVVSAGIDGASFEEAIPLALAAARAGEQRGTPATAGRMSDRIEHALELAKDKSGPEATRYVASQIGTSVAAIESVPMAFAVVRLADYDVWTAGLISANIGDDTDTIGAIACGMSGAASGVAALPADKVAQVIKVNRLDIAPIISGLMNLRQSWREKAA
jgi:ADP-ribosylglycohydrolase